MNKLLLIVLLAVSTVGCADGYYLTSGGYQRGYYNQYGQYPQQYGYGQGYPRQGTGYGYYYQNPPVYVPPVPTLQFNWSRPYHGNRWNNHEWREHHGLRNHRGRDRD